MRPLRRADKSAVIVVPNVKIRMQAQHSSPMFSHQNFLQENFNIRPGNIHGLHETNYKKNARYGSRSCNSNFPNRKQQRYLFDRKVWFEGGKVDKLKTTHRHSAGKTHDKSQSECLVK